MSKTQSKSDRTFVPPKWIAFKRLVNLQIASMLNTHSLSKENKSAGPILSAVLKFFVRFGALIAIALVCLVAGLFCAVYAPAATGSLVVLLTSVIAFAITFSRASGVMFASTDFDLTQTLPVPTHLVVLSKLLSTYLILLVVNIAVVLPLCIPDIVVNGAGAAQITQGVEQVVNFAGLDDGAGATGTSSSGMNGATSLSNTASATDSTNLTDSQGANTSNSASDSNTPSPSGTANATSTTNTRITSGAANAANSASSIYLVLYLASMVVAILFSQCIPMALALLLGFLVTLFVKRFRFSGTLILILGIIALSATMLIGANMRQSGVSVKNLSEWVSYAHSALNAYPLAALLEQAYVQASAVNLIVFSGVSLLVSLIAVLATAKFYVCANCAISVSRKPKKSKTTAELMRKKTHPFISLLKKELHLMLHTEQLAINVLSVDIILIVLVIAMTVMGNNEDMLSFVASYYHRLNFDDPEQMPNIISVFFPWFFAAILSRKSTCFYAVSLESHASWIMCTNPRPAKTQLFAKTLINLIDTFFVSFICAVLLFSKGFMGVAQAIETVFICVAFSYFVGACAIRFDAKNPTFDWSAPGDLTGRPNVAVPSAVFCTIALFAGGALTVSSFAYGNTPAILVSYLAGAFAVVVGCVMFSRAKILRLYC